jgi:hypothetical protein
LKNEGDRFMKEEFPYEDIVNLPPHVSERHPRPTMTERAARFAPFAAITGYEEMVVEEARITESFIELDEMAIETINNKLNLLKSRIKEEPKVSITYFERDSKKRGGRYITANGVVKSINVYENTILMADNRVFEVTNILDIDGEIFANF